MARLPKEARDLVLAPLAVENDRDERAGRIRRFALRNVATHGWELDVTEDNAAVRLKGGSVSLDLALGAGAMRFLEEAGA